MDQSNLIAVLLVFALLVQTLSGRGTLSGKVVSSSTAAGASTGYDIFLSAGQSNKFFGTGFDPGLDVSDSRIYQIYNGGLGTAGTLSPASANDPLDHPDTSNQTPSATYIGHDVHFVKDYYIANGALLSPRKVIIVPYGYGGSVVLDSNQWGALSGTLVTPTTNANSHLDKSITRTNSALAQTGTNTVKAVLWHQGEGDYETFGATPERGLANSYRRGLLRTFLYFRQHISLTVPIVLGRLSTYSIDAGAANFDKNGLIWDGIIQATVNRMPYLGLADSQSPSALGASGIHFTAAEQRSLAGRYWTGYQAALTNTLSTPTVWDSLDYPSATLGYPAGYTLSNGNLDCSGDANSGWKTMWATNPKTTGKIYAEFKVQAVNNNVNLGFIGFCNQDKGFDNYLGVAGTDGNAVKCAGMWDANGQGFQGYTQVWAGNQGNRAVNDIIMLALDITGGKAWIGKNGTWSNSGDPVAGTNPWVTGLVDGEMHFLAASIYTGTANTWRLQTTAASQSFAAPSGYTPWN